MNIKQSLTLLVVAFVGLLSSASPYHSISSNQPLYRVWVMRSDSDSVALNLNLPVISYDNRLYQHGILIGTYDKKTSMVKGKITTRVQIYDNRGKAVAEAVSGGVNASFAITIFETDERISLDLDFDQEEEQLALKLRQMHLLTAPAQ